MKKKGHWVSKVVQPSWFGGSFHYWPEELMPLAYAMACVEVVSTSTERSNEIYLQIIDAWGKPGVQAVYDEIISEIPYSDKKIWKQMIRNPEFELGQDIDKPPWKNLMMVILYELN